VAFENTNHILCTFDRLRYLRPLTHTANLKTPEKLGKLCRILPIHWDRVFLKNSLLVHTVKKLSAFYGI